MEKRKRMWLGWVCAVLILLAVFVGSWVYLNWYMVTDILASESEDGVYLVTVQRIGEPEANIFYYEHLRVSVERADGDLVDRKEFFILKERSSFRADDCQINWYPAGVEVRFEQPVYRYSSDYSTGISLDDLFYIPGWSKPLAWLYPQPPRELDAWIVPFAGPGDFPGYTADQALEVIQERYGGEIRLVGEEEESFTFSAGDAEFHAVNDVPLTDDFWELYTEHWTGEFSAAHNRIVSFVWAEESTAGYVPVLSFNGRFVGEVENFTRVACDLIERYMADPYLSPEGYMPGQLRYSVYGEELTIYLKSGAGEYDRTQIYSQIYNHVEENSLRIYESRLQTESEEQTEEESQLFQGVELTDEIWEQYLSLEPECSYVRPDGMELRMIGIDRALGSSFYILIAVSEDGAEYELVNWDPYLGHGGQTMWLNFPEDGEVGFSCLAYSGGAYGMLFRTEDGGKTFEQSTYPSANVELPDGELYNPFVMPEKVFVEDSVYYLLAGQGPNGDYYGEEGYCKGLYRSSDQGKTWKYVGEVPGVDSFISFSVS